MKKSIIIISILTLGVIIFLRIYLYNKNQNITDEEYIIEIDNYINQIVNTNNIKVIQDSNDEKILGEDVKEYKKYFETDKIQTETTIYDNKGVQIVPMPDGIDIQRFYYKDKTLVLYETEFTGIGGTIKYYFKDGKNIKQINESESLKYENEQIILQKSDNVYSKYINKR